MDLTNIVRLLLFMLTIRFVDRFEVFMYLFMQNYPTHPQSDILIHLSANLMI